MTGAEASSSGAPASEPLACVACRSRKLKCDRLRPICTRCAKVKGECVYPESRRKPAFRRRNVKELEARLAQVEDMLRESKEADRSMVEDNSATVDADAGMEDALENGWAADFDFSESLMESLAAGTVPFINAPTSTDSAPFFTPSTELDSESPPSQLIGLNQLEALPPFEVIEALHQLFFAKMHHFIPLVHPARYLQAFYSAPHLRPPMCLQYAIWTLASNGDDKYGSYHDVFYERTRKYLEVDEMKGYGEHFITVAHAQAWGLIATDEARCMLFTRSGMSGARCVRLCEMMGLQRLDDDIFDGNIAEVLPPVTCPAELEERRRTFWAAFCIDSHASISTGWPNLIDPKTITTRLPGSEEAFVQGLEEKTPTLTEALGGAPYSTFAAAIIVCHIFNRLSAHIHRPMPGDRVEDVDYGEFWKRHRDLDNILSSAFMFLPPRFRLPKNVNNPVAAHTNMNLHASVIALHTCAYEKAEKFNLPASVKKTSLDRMLTAALEVVNIMKLTSHTHHGYRSPMVALSLYCAACVFIYHWKDNGTDPAHIDNLEFLVRCMEAIGREHIITRAFLQQTVADIDHNHVAVTMQLPFRDKTDLAPVGNCIPLLARSALSRYSEMATPLPGRLPLSRPQGSAFPRNPWHPDAARLSDTGERVTISLPKDFALPLPGTLLPSSAATAAAANNKRRRLVSPEPSLGSTSSPSAAPGGTARDDEEAFNPGLWLQDDDAVVDDGEGEGGVGRARSPVASSSRSAAGQCSTRQTSLPHRMQQQQSTSSLSAPTTTTTPPPTLSSLPEGRVPAAAAEEIFSAARVFARAVENGVLGGLDGLGEFMQHIDGWDAEDTEELYLQVQRATAGEGSTGGGGGGAAGGTGPDGVGGSRPRREGR